MKKKVRFIMTVVRDYEIDMDDYKDLEEVKTLEDAAKFDCESFQGDPFMFMDNEDTKLDIKFEILED